MDDEKRTQQETRINETAKFILLVLPISLSGLPVDLITERSSHVRASRRPVNAHTVEDGEFQPSVMMSSQGSTRGEKEKEILIGVSFAATAN